jgi:hypothetical protein
MYTETEAQTTQRHNVHTYHAPHGNQAERYTQVRAAVSELSRLLNTLCPSSRELSLAQTKLEEAVFWANAAIARNETKPTG